MSTGIAERAVTGGTVFDIGYRSYSGERQGRMRGRMAVFRNGVRTALGIGRSVRAKVLPWFFIVVLNVIALIMVLIAGAAERLGGPGAAEQMDLPSHVDYYGITAIMVFMFAALVAPELLCRDRRERTINLYLVRPLSGTDYVFSRYAAFLAVMLAAVWLPQIALFLGLLLDSPAPLQYLSAHWLDVPRFLAAGVVLALFTTGLAMLVASFTSRRAYASIFLVGVYVVTVPFTAGLSTELAGAAAQWLSMFHLPAIPVHVNDLIFGEVSELTEEAPARQLSASVRVGWYLLWTITPALILWRRYRRLSP